MNLLNLFKSKPIRLTLQDVEPRIFENCKKYGYVNFHFEERNNAIMVYGPNFIGGDGKIGYLPPKYSRKVISKNIKQAEIVLAEDNNCTIVY